MKIKRIAAVLIAISCIFFNGCGSNDKKIKSKVSSYVAYNEALTLSRNNLEYRGEGVYYFGGFRFRSEDLISDEITGFLKPGALYRAVSDALSNYLNGDRSDWDAVCTDILGLSPDASGKLLEERVYNASSFISRDNGLEKILKKLPTVEACEGTVDENGAYTEFSITDFTAVSDELGISEKMLGYCLAYLDESEPTVLFYQNRYEFKKGDADEEKTKTSENEAEELGSSAALKADDFAVLLPNTGEVRDIAQVLKDDGRQCAYRYFRSLSGSAENKKNVIETSRKIHIGATADEVFAAYGKSEMRPTTENTFYKLLLSSDANQANMLAKTAPSCVTYEYNGELAVDFFFTAQNELWLIAYRAL